MTSVAYWLIVGGLILAFLSFKAGQYRAEIKAARAQSKLVVKQAHRVQELNVEFANERRRMNLEFEEAFAVLLDQHEIELEKARGEDPK